MDWIKINQRIQDLALKLCQCPQGSREQAKIRSELFRLIYKPLKLLGRKCTSYSSVTRGNRTGDPDYYEDALQKTLLFCTLNICPSPKNTGKPYNSEQGSILNWLKNYLCFRLRDFREQEMAEAKAKAPVMIDEDGNVKKVEIQAPSEASFSLDDIKAWIEADKDGELQACHVRNCPKANCQELLLKRLPFDTYQKWSEISETLMVGFPTLSGHYRKKCLELLRNYLEQEGI